MCMPCFFALYLCLRVWRKPMSIPFAHCRYVLSLNANAHACSEVNDWAMLVPITIQCLCLYLFMFMVMPMLESILMQSFCLHAYDNRRTRYTNANPNAISMPNSDTKTNANINANANAYSYANSMQCRGFYVFH